MALDESPQAPRTNPSPPEGHIHANHQRSPPLFQAPLIKNPYPSSTLFLHFSSPSWRHFQKLPCAVSMLRTVADSLLGTQPTGVDGGHCAERKKVHRGLVNCLSNGCIQSAVPSPTTGSSTSLTPGRDYAEFKFSLD